MSSLGGKNTPARGRGARSSRASSTIYKKLQKLDRRISKFKLECDLRFMSRSQARKNYEKLIELDEERKRLRYERKRNLRD